MAERVGNIHLAPTGCGPHVPLVVVDVRRGKFILLAVLDDPIVEAVESFDGRSLEAKNVVMRISTFADVPQENGWVSAGSIDRFDDPDITSFCSSRSHGEVVQTYQGEVLRDATPGDTSALGRIVDASPTLCEKVVRGWFCDPDLLHLCEKFLYGKALR